VRQLAPAVLPRRAPGGHTAGRGGRRRSGTAPPRGGADRRTAGVAYRTAGRHRDVVGGEAARGNRWAPSQTFHGMDRTGRAGRTAGNDSVPTPESPPPPVTSPGAAPPEQVAADFTRAWLKHDGVTAAQWRQGMAKYATPALLDKFKDTDPAGVPAKRTTGPV